ncbi:hypothetical protein [Gloeothece verrucosa]|uniref:Uncharacterized protein n=1 Tax=Gloeothece verrucosa (strain PCC 7822) TaxID=497965 RepID=E0ULP6_GLOV7|nr:hypothetical protein [Gloeothece verrucosa]ADN17876.1 conserved hypothetical protein [Gloeothece verrucosa PCC 7822]
MSTLQKYHGWMISIIDEPIGFSFYCCFPLKRIALDGCQIYSTQERALAIAKDRIDLALACLALMNFLNEAKQRLYYLSSQEHEVLSYYLIDLAQFQKQDTVWGMGS